MRPSMQSRTRKTPLPSRGNASKCLVKKHSLLRLVLTASFLTCIHSGFAQTPLASDPVGLTTISCLSNSDTLISPPFTRPPEFTGSIQSISGNVITVSGTPVWTNNQFIYAGGTQPKHYYALIGPSSTADPKEGHTYAVTANGSNTLTVDVTHDSLTGIPADTQMLVIPYWTLATIFPASDQNVSFTPTTSTAAYKTQVRLPDYTATGINLPYSPVYFFSNNVDGTSSNVGWRVVGNDTTDHGDDPLPPDRYFVVRNANNAPTLPLISLGGLLTKKLTVPLMTTTGSPQDNPVSILRPLNVALDATGLGPADGSFVANDQLLLFENSTVAFDKAPNAIYSYNTAVGNTGGWRLSGDTSTDHGNDVIAKGTGLVIRKVATAGGQTAFWTNSWPVSALSAVSRKSHGAAGVFDVNLPLTGNPGIECRSGQGTNSDQHQVIITFPISVTFGSAAVTSGTGTVTSTSGNATTTVTVNLSGVTNAQRITVTLVAVNDGTSTNDIAVRMGLLFGDATGNGIVSNTDVNSVKAQIAAPVDSSNFRDDVNANGVISNTDVSLTKAQVGTALP
jgi:uncharacterized protein (TIGR02597 family)